MTTSPDDDDVDEALVVVAASAAQNNAPGDPTKNDGDVVSLSPFEVVSDTKGYYASNTMSGTRFNSKLEDLGASISVMTKEQMQDFAMLDINDIFDYMASTEGTGSYSQFDTDRTGAVVDQVSLNPNNANRVRGLGNAKTRAAELMGNAAPLPFFTKHFHTQVRRLAGG